ncbi:MAG: hypothetical protein IPP79_20640 [Chitinophagaceae bacterium]|nr:hypothetical protein [Chitinophagaceae bacterium]
MRKQKLTEGAPLGISFLNQYQKIVRTILGETFQILPNFDLPNPSEFKSALEGSDKILPKNDRKKNPMFIEQWLDGVGRVRDKMGHLEQMILMREVYLDFAADILPKPLQLPYRTKDSWIGLDIPQDYFEKHASDAVQVSRDKLSLMMIFDSLQDQISHWGSNDTVPTITGLLLDEWTEVIPNKEETTGIAFHFDQPNMEAPQSILLPLPRYGTGTNSENGV